MATSFYNISSSLLTRKLHITRSKPTFPVSLPSPRLQPRSLSLKYPPTNNPFKICSLKYTATKCPEPEGNPAVDRWREIHGEDNWVGLLDPLDPTLRSELLRYGEMVLACNDGFYSDPKSTHHGSYKYEQHEFGYNYLEGYTVTRYLYATSTINLPDLLKTIVLGQPGNASWIGYVAVSDDDMSARIGRRDIVVAWRGSMTRVEWFHDLIDIFRPISSGRIPCPDRTVKVESGMEKLYTAKEGQLCESPRRQVIEEIQRLIRKYGDEKEDGLELSITTTGHSLGSSLAVLSAFDVAETGTNLTQWGTEVPVRVISFAGPRVGNSSFKKRLEEELAVKVLRIYNVRDMVPRTPGFLVNEHCPGLAFVDELFPWAYSHVGVPLELDHHNSTFLPPAFLDGIAAHDLKMLLHLLDGYQGSGEAFRLSTARNIPPYRSTKMPRIN